MMNNDNYDTVNNYYYNVITYVFIGLFLIALVIFFACLLILSGLKVNILIIIKTRIESLKIKNQSYYY